MPTIYQNYWKINHRSKKLIQDMDCMGKKCFWHVVPKMQIKKGEENIWLVSKQRRKELYVKNNKKYNENSARCKTKNDILKVLGKHKQFRDQYLLKILFKDVWSCPTDFWIVFNSLFYLFLLWYLSFLLHSLNFNCLIPIVFRFVVFFFFKEDTEELIQNIFFFPSINNKGYKLSFNCCFGNTSKF